MSLIDDIRKDREAGTPGPWRILEGKHCAQIHSERFWLANMKCEACPAHELANTRRIARIPEMEAALLAAEELAASLEKCLEVLPREDERLCCDGHECGCHGATKHQEANHYARAALTAFQKALK